MAAPRTADDWQTKIDNLSQQVRHLEVLLSQVTTRVSDLENVNEELVTTFRASSATIVELSTVLTHHEELLHSLSHPAAGAGGANGGAGGAAHNLAGGKRNRRQFKTRRLRRA